MVTSVLCLYAVVVMGLDLAVASLRRRLVPVGAAAAAALCGMLIVSWGPDYAPHYRPVIADAGEQFEERGCHAGTVDIHVLPGGAWVARFPCAAFAD